MYLVGFYSMDSMVQQTEPLEAKDFLEYKRISTCIPLHGFIVGDPDWPFVGTRYWVAQIFNLKHDSFFFDHEPIPLLSDLFVTTLSSYVQQQLKEFVGHYNSVYKERLFFPRTCNVQLNETDSLYFRIIPAAMKALVERDDLLLDRLKDA